MVSDRRVARLIGAEVRGEWGKGDGKVTEALAALEERMQGRGGLDPYMAHGGAQGAKPGNLGNQPFRVYSARATREVAESFHQDGVDRKRLRENDKNNRFGAALYAALDRVTAMLERWGTHFNVSIFHPERASVLDLTDPQKAKAWGYGKGTPKGPLTQEIGHGARVAGYDAIRVPSVKTGKANMDVLDNFDRVLERVGVEMVSPEVAKAARQRMGGGLKIGGPAAAATLAVAAAARPARADPPISEILPRSPDGWRQREGVRASPETAMGASERHEPVKKEVGESARHELTGVQRVWEGIGYKVKTGTENLAVRPVAQALGVLYSVGKVLLDAAQFLKASIQGLFGSGSERWGHLTESFSALRSDAAAVVQAPVRMLAGIAGYLLGFSPQHSAVHKLSEKLDNGSLWGAYIDDATLKARVRSQLRPGAKALLSLGVNTNMIGDPKFRSVQEGYLSKEMKNPQFGLDKHEKDRAERLFGQFNVISAYTGNVLADTLLMGGEHGGFAPVTRKLKEFFNDNQYVLYIGHSAGKWALVNAREKIDPARTMIWGGPGTFSDPPNQQPFFSVQRNGTDLVPGLGVIHPDLSNTYTANTTGKVPTFVGVGLAAPVFGKGKVQQFKDADRNPVTDHGWPRYYLRGLDQIETLLNR